MSAAIDDKEFANLLKEKAKTGDAEFQYQVGQCYYKGDIIEKNYDEAKKWLVPAANQEHAAAQHRLGCIFNIEKDYNESVKWYEPSARQGYALAQNNLAVCYERGEGVPQDYTEALRLYDLSAKQGYWRASRNIGRLYYDAEAIEQDLPKARMYYEMALANADYPDDPAPDEMKRKIKEYIEDISKKIEETEKKAEAARRAERTEIFISYAHKDAVYIEEMRPHLEALKKTTNIKWWDDTQIKPGDDWSAKIKEALSKAKIMVLLVSAHFIASEYVWNEELPKILESANNEGATILWLPVSFCDYEDTDIDKYQAVTDPRNPLSKCTPADRDEVYMKLSKRIKELFKVQAER